MSADWKIYRLGQITDWFSGGTPRKNIDRYWNGDIPWISASSMSNNRISTSDLKITNEGLKSGSKLANKDDILLLVRGSILHQKIPVGIVMNEVSYNQDVKRIKVKDNLNPWFLLYWFMGNEKTLLRKVDVTGIGAGKFDTDFLQNYPISLPSLKEQKIIVDIVKSLDDKIYLNNQINQTLESIAQAMFKSWFIDFEPVRAKIAAKQEGKNSELAAMCAISGKSEAELEQMAEDDFAELQATAALFPDELVESELGEVPKGWEISKISKIGKVVTGKTPPSKIENSFAEEGTLFITPTDIDTEIFVTNTNRYLTKNGEIAIKNSSVNAGSLCVTCIGSQMGKVVITPKRAFTNQQINSILLFNNALRNYIFLNLRQRRDEIFLIGSGGSTMPIINKSTFESLNLILPDLNLIRKFDNFITPFFNNILKNSVENVEIKNMRDLLLPELLSGKINLSMLKDM